jgi:hypothetical protein
MLMRTIARARLPDKKMERAESAYTLFEKRRRSTATEEATAAPIAVIRGFKPKRRPRATPASDT